MLPSINIKKKNIFKKQYTVTPFEATYEQIGKTCSICGDNILNGELIVLCPECKLPYHHECWREMGGCGSYGCLAAPDIKKADYAPSDTYVAGWQTEKKCPECGAMIISDALICRFCKAEFPTEKPMTTFEWKNRIYDNNELIKVRIMVIVQFFLSVFGLLTIFLFPINLFTVLSDSWFFKIKRLPEELKILQYASTIISSIWLLVMILLFVSMFKI